MAYNFAPDRWWHCLHYNEWLTITSIRGAAGYGLGFITDIELSAACIISGLTYGSSRFEAFTDTYGMTKVTQPLPPPLDTIWQLSPTIWNAIDAAIAGQGDPQFCECIIFAFKGNQGGAWPECWP